MLNGEVIPATNAHAGARRLGGSPRTVGVIGAGFMGRTHAIAARNAGVEVLGVVASAPARLPAAVAAVGADRGYESLAALLGDTEIEAVHVCVPNAAHFEVALAAIEAGKHVICEKPLALDTAQASALHDAADAAGVTAAVPFVYRFHPMVREMRARIAAGSTGEIGLVHGSYLQDWLARSTFNWRVDPATGGASRAFADIGSHWFDLLEFVTGDRVAEVAARFTTLHPERSRGDGRSVAVFTEDTAVVQFRLASGVIGSFVASQVATGRKNRLLLEISGVEQSLAFDQEEPERLWVGEETGHRVLVRDPDTLSPTAAAYAILPSGHAQGYQDCFNAFVRDTYRAIAGALPEGLPDFASGLRSARIVDAVVTSSREGGRWLAIKPERMGDGA